jgi:hypothetical protein
MLRVVITGLRNRADLGLMMIVMTFMVGDNAEILCLKVTSNKCFDDSNENAIVVKSKKTGKVVYDTDPFNTT